MIKRLVVVVVVKNDAEIMNSDVAQLLAPECRISDTSWIKPGKVAWDWWNNTNITGVDFKSGMNTPTYKYYIDFAAKNNLEYIIIDEGWRDRREGAPFCRDPRTAAYGQPCA